MYNPKVSIVIPAYNAANFLAEAIESALAQTYQNIEIIVVNDGSKDEGATEQVASMYKDKIIYIAKANGGSSSALNAGIMNMTGEWFSWLSHDDLYYPNKVEEEIAFLNGLIEKGIPENLLFRHILFGAADLIDGEGKIIRKETQKRIEKTEKRINCPEGSLNLIAVPTQDGFHGCSCLVHKNAFADVGMFDENLRLLNDMDLWYRFYINDYEIHFIPQVLVMGRVHAKQVSRSIGFSYHNAEQDMFWNRNLQWLTQHHSNNYKVFYEFGKTALKKTRFAEGRKAFQIAAKIDPKKRASLCLEQVAFCMYAKCKAFMKSVYLTLFSRC